VVRLASGVEGLELEELADHFREAGVMRQKTPERLEVVDRIPRNPTGKVLKQELRERFGRRSALD
jgi:non-ribosomal peptide synthetase component E (peptide arylation enzyme)